MPPPPFRSNPVSETNVILQQRNHSWDGDSRISGIRDSDTPWRLSVPESDVPQPRPSISTVMMPDAPDGTGKCSLQQDMKSLEDSNDTHPAFSWPSHQISNWTWTGDKSDWLPQARRRVAQEANMNPGTRRRTGGSSTSSKSAKANDLYEYLVGMLPFGPTSCHCDQSAGCIDSGSESSDSSASSCVKQAPGDVNPSDIKSTVDSTTSTASTARRVLPAAKQTPRSARRTPRARPAELPASVNLRSWDGQRTTQDILDALPPPHRSAPAAQRAESEVGRDTSRMHVLNVRLSDDRWELLLFNRDSNLERESASFLKMHRLNPKFESKLLEKMWRMVQAGTVESQVDIVDLL